MTRLEFRILGPLSVWTPQRRAVELGARKQRAVLAMLLLEPGRVVSVDRIVDGLWGADVPASATGTLQAYISQLRRALEPDRAPRTPPAVLLTQEPGYLLAAAGDRIDAVRFTTGVEAARAQRDPERAEQLLTQALANWSGEALADFADETFAAAAVARLNELRDGALEDLAEIQLGTGRPAAAVASARALLERRPFRERSWAQLMLGLYREGRQAEALAAFRQARTVLDEELGLPPGPELTALETAILQHDPKLAGPRGALVAQAARTAQSARSEDAGTDPGRKAGNDPGKLVGRQAEQRRIADRIAQAAKGNGGVLLIVGEAGLGKTSLAEHAAEQARPDLTVAWSRCAEASATPAFWPWTQILRAIGGSEDLLDALAGRRAADHADPETALFELHEQVAEALHTPLLIVIDDLHAADPASLQLLAHLAPTLHRRPILVLATLRPETSEAAVRETLALLANERGAERIRLAALTEADVAEYVKRPGPVAHALLERTGGNPFYLKELLRLLESEYPDGWGDTQAVAAAGVPESVRDVIARRLSRLPAPARELLETAAVIGRDVDLLLLAAGTGREHDQVMAGLEPVIGIGMLLEVPDSWDYRFSHALVRDTVYGSLTRLQRARLHKRVGEALEAFDRPDDPEHLGRLVHHFTMAARLGVADRAVRYARRAAELAMAQLAYDEAARYLESALGALDPTGPGAAGERGRLLVQLGLARRAAGDLDGTRAVLDEALTLARPLGDDELAMDAATLFGGATLWTWRPYLTVDERMIAILREQLDRLGPDDVYRRAVLLGTLAVELYHHPDREQGEAHAAEAVRLARGLGDPELLARTLNNAWNVAWVPQRLAERRATTDELLAIPGLPRTVEVMARLHRMITEVSVGDVAGFDADLARAVRLAEEIRSPVLPAQVRYAQAGRAVLAGDWEAGERLVGEAFALQEHTSLWGTQWIRLAMLYTSRRFQGRAGELRDELIRRADEPHLQLLRPTAVLAACESGDEELARALVERWGTAREQLWCWDFVAFQWALVAARLGTPDPRELYAEIEPYADRFPTLGTGCATWGTLGFALAGLAARLGEPGKALVHAEAALAAHRRLGAAHLIAASEAQVADLVVSKS
ncbi:AAA family ATPase [Dactylosporangium vinaceum]|uniref:BTAD domain-containing putative transcriptional regulator n=1 Tax=Dactylosporangium vinaceum TaxID=53362 RepID=A0ABV5M4U9_9ACTN|nr:BTAD domain-containing putative transcriptional regulator [Dactylosporangium vinaceum]UAB96062.1 AAA family ATPase [Dactylosporangium vinaceum]